MNLHEPVFRNISKDRMQDLLKNAAGVLGGKHVSGEKRQHAEPDERGNPRQQFARGCYRSLVDRW